MKSRNIAMAFLSAGLLSSCFSSHPTAKIEPEEQLSIPKCYSHKVQYPGETLASIAQWYTGDMNNWRAIVKANNDLDERRLGIGSVLCIPYSMVIKQVPYPKPSSFRNVSVRKTVETSIEEKTEDEFDSVTENAVKEVVSEPTRNDFIKKNEDEDRSVVDELPIPDRLEEPEVEFTLPVAKPKEPKVVTKTANEGADPMLRIRDELLDEMLNDD